MKKLFLFALLLPILAFGQHENEGSAETTQSVPKANTIYPISGVLVNKKVEGTMIVADLYFTNNGSKPVSSFECVLKFYSKGDKIYEIKLSDVKNHSGFPFGENETIPFRAALPIMTDNNLANAPVDALILLVEVTKIR
jgi:hypothetical protein